MSPYLAPPKAWFMIFRVMAVMVWSVTTVTMSTAWAILDQGRVDWLNAALAVLTAAIVQGFPAHIVNEITDWQSGADRLPWSGRKSGGAKVLRCGLATIPQLWRMFWITSAMALLPVVWLTLRTDGLTLVMFFIGYLVCLFYTLPPLRLVYRPFAGEWLAAFPGIVLNVLGAYYVQTLRVTPGIVMLAVGSGFLYITIMILFHYLDMDSDAKAVPPKRTSVVALGLSTSKRYVQIVGGAAIIIFALLAWHESRCLILLTGAALVWVFQSYCRPDSDESIVRTGKIVTYALSASSLLFASVVRLEFLLVAVVMCVSFVLHKRFGKLPAHFNPMSSS